MGLDSNVLVLNRLWQAVNVVNGRRAVALVYVGRGRAVDSAYSTYDWDQWIAQPAAPDEAGDGCVHTVDGAVPLPRVIQLLDYDRVPRPRVKFTRSNVYLRDSHVCQYCGHRRPAGELTLDHVNPRSRGGRTTWRNIVVSCFRCNARKADRLPEEAGMPLLREPRQPAWHPGSSLRIADDPHPLWQPFLTALPRSQ